MTSPASGAVAVTGTSFARVAAAQARALDRAGCRLSARVRGGRD
jgi:hypothetical protein